MVQPPSRLQGQRVRYGVHPSSVLGTMSERESKNATNMSIRINNIQGEISDSSQVPAKVGKDE